MNARISVEQFNAFVNHLYEAAVSAEHWPSCMENVADLLNADSTGLTVHFSHRRKGAMMLMSRFDPALQAEYDQYYCGVNIWKNRFAHLYQEGSVLNSAGLCTGQELERSEWYNDYLRRAGVYHSMGAVLIRNEEVSCVVTVLRGRRQGPFDHEQSVLALVAPHFQRALRIHQMVSVYQSTSQALDALPAAVFLLDLELRVRYVSPRAENLLRKEDGLALRDGQLTASTPASQRLLAAALNGARRALLHPISSKLTESYFALERPSGAAALQVFASPARLSVPQLPYSPGVVLCIRDPNAVDSSPERLKQIFGFTSQEARLAIHLARGGDLRSASQQLRISYETARKHLSNLRAKAHADNQSDLVRLILNGIAPAGATSERV